MTDPNPHAVHPADEGRHLPSDDPLWNESHYLDFVSHDGTLSGYARIGLYPNLGVTWWTTTVVGPDRPLVASFAYDLPVAPRPGLAVDAAGHVFDGVVNRPLDAFRLTASVPAVLHEDPADVYHGAAGSPTALDLDLTWTTDGVPTTTTSPPATRSPAWSAGR